MISPLTPRALGAALACTLLAAVLWTWNAEPTTAYRGDSPQFMSVAYNLFAHAAFSTHNDADPPPSGGREPGYPLFVAGLMALDPVLGGFTLDCLERDTSCPPETYRRVQAANGVFIALAGLAVFVTAWLLTGRALAAFAAGGLIWLNGELAGGRHDLMSDYQALFLLTASMAAAAWAATRPGAWRWLLVGALLALTALTKAIFLYLFLALSALTLMALPFRGPNSERRHLAAGLLCFALAFVVVAGPWMARNAAVTGKLAIATDDRAGIALNVRNEYNRMTPTQFVAAFVYWTRGFGDNLAKQLFASEVLADFAHDSPGSFMHDGHLYGQEVRARMDGEGLSQAEVEAEIDARVRAEILGNPAVHAATTLPLFYRGLWIDEFVVFTFPALLWLTWAALRRRRWAVLMALSGGWFSLALYPLVSLNIDRYQVPAVPALALAGGLAAAALYDRLKKLRSRSPTADRV